MCFKFADDIAAVIAAKQGRLPPCTTVVGKVELLTARVCFFALSNVEAIERHAETIEQRRRTVGTVPDLRLCRTGTRRRIKNHPYRLHGCRGAVCPHRIAPLQAGFSLDRPVNSCAASRYGTAQILFFATVDMLRIRRRPGSRSDRRDNGFVGPARRAIIDPQIEAGFLRFDASQQQRPAAFGTGRPKIINEFVFWDLCHSAQFMSTFPGAKASQLCRSCVGRGRGDRRRRPDPCGSSPTPIRCPSR